MRMKKRCKIFKNLVCTSSFKSEKQVTLKLCEETVISPLSYAPKTTDILTFEKLKRNILIENNFSFNSICNCHILAITVNVSRQFRLLEP